MRRLCQRIMTGIKLLNNIRFGIRTKTVVGLGILLFFALAAMGAVNYFYGSALAIRKTLNITREKITNDTHIIGAIVSRYKVDMLVLRELPPVQGIVRARDNKGIDPNVGERTEYWSARLKNIFKVFLT